VDPANHPAYLGDVAHLCGEVWILASVQDRVVSERVDATDGELTAFNPALNSGPQIDAHVKHFCLDKIPDP
jgi:hypothetical protein